MFGGGPAGQDLTPQALAVRRMAAAVRASRECPPGPPVPPPETVPHSKRGSDWAYKFKGQRIQEASNSIEGALGLDHCLNSQLQPLQSSVATGRPLQSAAQ